MSAFYFSLHKPVSCITGIRWTKFKQIQYTALIQLLFSLAASEPAHSGQGKAFFFFMTDAALAFTGLCVRLAKAIFLYIDLQLLIVEIDFKAGLAGPVTHYMHGRCLSVSPNGHLVPVGMKGNA